MTRRQLQILTEMAKPCFDAGYIWDSAWGLRFRQMIRVSRFETTCRDELLRRSTVQPMLDKGWVRSRCRIITITERGRRMLARRRNHA